MMSDQPLADRTVLSSRLDHPGSSVRRALGALLPNVPRVQLHEHDTDDSSPQIWPTSDQLPALSDSSGRYQLDGEIARGGMGAVLKGRDTDLGREIALKVLLDCHTGQPKLLQRFIEEAQVAGQLQHPGIVPVYELGTFADQRPFFTMKLVKGQTLSKLLAQRKDPTQERPRWLGVFLQVCQALAYAHARGVIHRDLKPSNIMVGNFGEVQVMDWGLAKVLPRDGAGDERISREHHLEGPQEDPPPGGSTGTESDSAQTAAGSVLGTPAYMAPEQARGQVDRLDERSDVFGLGAILCEILTGKPPYVGTDSRQLHLAAVRANLAGAISRLDECGADAELVGLTRRCLALDMGSRPRDAGVLANELQAYLEGVEERLRQAELAQAQAQVRVAEERKRRHIQLGLVVALVGLVGLATGGGLYLTRQQELRNLERAQRQRDLEAAVQTSLEKADVLRRQARWSEASTLLHQIHSQLPDEAPPPLRERLEQALADVDLVSELEDIRMKMANLIENQFDRAGAERRYVELFARRGLGSDTEDPAVVAGRVRESAVREQLVAALDDWAFNATRDLRRANWLLAVARLADPHPWRDRVRDPALWKNREKARELLTGATPEDLSPQLAIALCGRLEARQAIELLQRVRRSHRDDFFVNLDLSGLVTRTNPDEGLLYAEVAVASRPTVAVAHNNLATALLRKGPSALDEALACIGKALELDPRYAIAHLNRGVILSAKGHVDEAIACYRQALALDPGLAQAHNNLGLISRRQGKLDEAIACFRQALERQPRFAPAHENLGRALKARGQPDEAIACFRKALEFDPRSVEAHIDLGLMLRDNGQVDEAITCFRQALEIDPRSFRAHNSLGTIFLVHKRDQDQAVVCFRKALELDPGNGGVHYNLGHALFRQGNYAEARQAYARAVELLPAALPQRALASKQIQLCERLAKLAERLPGLLRGEEQPGSADECLDLTTVCRHQQRYAAAARFSAAAFVREPKLANDPTLGHRYAAACYAAQAAAGRGRDAERVGPLERLALRRQALSWLRADLDRWRMLADKGDGRVRQVIAKQLMSWRQDADLAGLRDGEALKALPAEERQACERLWADVEAFVRQVQPK
jgi:serine/threonine-protein kinase